MATVDYFAGQNEGNKNLMNALDTYTKDERQKRQDALTNELLQQKIQEGNLAVEQAQNRRKTLADISRISGLTEKTPATTRLTTALSQEPVEQISSPTGINRLAGITEPTEQIADPTGLSQRPAITSAQETTPAINYTPQEKDQMIMDTYRKYGDIDSMSKLQGVHTHQSEEARKTVELISAVNMKTGGNLAKTKELLKVYNKLGGGQFSDADIDSIASITQGQNGTIVATRVLDPVTGNPVGYTYVDQTGKGAHLPVADPMGKVDDNHLYAVSLKKDAQGNPTPEAQQAQAILKAKHTDAVEVAGAKVQKTQDIKSAEGFKSWTPEAKNQTFMYNLITKEPPVSARGMTSGDRQQYGKEYAQWQIDKGFAPQDIALMQSDYKAGSMSLNNMAKQEAPMSAFVLNINKQIEKVKQLYDNNDRTGLRLLDLPVRELKTKALGSGDEAIKASYLLEISNEIGKLSSGASASVQQLSDSAKEDWKKVHDVNLSMGEIMKVVNATRDQANMRIGTWRDAKEEVRNAIKGIGAQPQQGQSPNRNDNNNPLHIKVGSQTKQHIDSGAATVDEKPAKDGGQFLKFNDPQQGLTAAWDLLFNSPTYKNMTVNDAMLKWSNKGYGGDIAPDVRGKKVSSLTQPERSQLMIGMMKREGTLKRTGTDTDTGRKVALLSNGAQIYVE